MPIVSVIVTADKIRQSPLYEGHIADGHIENPRTTMSHSNLNHLIDAVYKLAIQQCVRKIHQPHSCVSIDARSYDNGESIHVTVVYMLECLYDTWHEAHFIEAIKNCMNQSRVASHPNIMPPGISRC